MVLRHLTGRQLRVASERITDRIFDKMRKMGRDVFRAIGEAEQTDAVKAEVEKKRVGKSDPLSSYDVDTLLGFGIASWSYAEDGTSVPVSDETIATLDDETSTWAATALLKMAKVIRDEAAEKNG